MFAKYQPLGNEENLDWAHAYLLKNFSKRRSVLAAVPESRKTKLHNFKRMACLGLLSPCIWPEVIVCMPLICWIYPWKHRYVANLIIVTELEILLVSRKPSERDLNPIEHVRFEDVVSCSLIINDTQLSIICSNQHLFQLAPDDAASLKYCIDQLLFHTHSDYNTLEKL